MSSNVLVIAPHADDEVLGCGGTIVKHVLDGDKVYLCVVTMAYTPDWTIEQITERQLEITKVQAILGIEGVFRLGLPTVKLDTVPQRDINDLILNVIQRVKPRILYIPHKGDINRDHQIVFDAAMVAARPVSAETPSRILSYEVLSATEWSAPFAEYIFRPNVYIDISDTLEAKIMAMRAYQHGLRLPPHPRSEKGMLTLATLRGLTIGVEAAEAFSLVREIKRHGGESEST